MVPPNHPFVHRVGTIIFTIHFGGLNSHYFWFNIHMLIHPEPCFSMWEVDQLQLFHQAAAPLNSGEKAFHHPSGTKKQWRLIDFPYFWPMANRLWTFGDSMFSRENIKFKHFFQGPLAKWVPRLLRESRWHKKKHVAMLHLRASHFLTLLHIELSPKTGRTITITLIQTVR